jgi:hypothetical protein
MNDLGAALMRLLTEPGVLDVTFDALEDDGSVGIRVRFRTQIGVMLHLTAADSIEALPERINDLIEEGLDPR